MCLSISRRWGAPRVLLGGTAPPARVRVSWCTHTGFARAPRVEGRAGAPRPRQCYSGYAGFSHRLLGVLQNCPLSHYYVKMNMFHLLMGLRCALFGDALYGSFAHFPSDVGFSYWFIGVLCVLNITCVADIFLQFVLSLFILFIVSLTEFYSSEF